MRTLTWLGLGLSAAALVACSPRIDETGDGGTTASSGGSGGAPAHHLTGGGGVSATGGAPGTGGAPATGGGGSTSGPDAAPPQRGPARAGDGPGAVFAMRKLYLGSTDRDGAPDSQAWKGYGYDVDGIDTQCSGAACSALNRCKPFGGASASQVFPNGAHGIDNAFGRNIVPMLVAVKSNAEATFNAALAAGDWTILFDVDGLGAGTDYNPLTSRLYAAAPLGGVPTFDGSDAWPVRFEQRRRPERHHLGEGAVLDLSYVTSDTWVSGPGLLTLPLVSGLGWTLTLDIGAAVVSFEMSTDHATATNGIISGVLDTEQFVEAVRQVLTANDLAFCNGATAESILNQVRGASDIMKDGTPGDPNETCDGISIGLGFDAAPAQIGDVAPPSTPTDPCNPSP